MIFLAGVLLAAFVVSDEWRLPVVIGFAILEIAETTITWRWSRRGKPKVGPETLIGALGTAATDCRPGGTVRVAGEVWRAHCDAGADAGQRVRVLGRHGLTLLVEPATES